MNRKWQSKFVVAFFVATAVATSTACAFTFDDIEFWVGTGANRAAMVVDWSDTSSNPPALVWGYRWDGTAFGRDMLKAVVAADDRLYAKIGGSLVNPVAIYGLGYDANNDGSLALDDNTSFNEEGFALSSPADGGASVDVADHYAEGWFNGFWHYGQASSNPYAGGAWSDAPLGMAGRTLTDGAWDSWVFTPSFNFASFAVNPQAAPSPFPPGDFDQDGAVTAADYDVWKSAFGSTSELAADASGNGVVDAADFTVWRDRLPADQPFILSSSLSVPEPSTLASMLTFTLVFPRNRLRPRKVMRS